MRRKLVISAIVVLGAALMAAARGSVTYPDFNKLTEDQIYAKMGHMWQDQQQRITPLVHQLKMPGIKPLPRAILGVVLGWFRAREAVQPLLAQIQATNPTRNEPGFGIQTGAGWGPYPAVRPLISIGMPSVRAILKALPGESNALRRKLMVQVMIGVEGKAVSRFRLQGLKAKQQNPQFQAHLAAALKDLEQAQDRSKMFHGYYEKNDE